MKYRKKPVIVEAFQFEGRFYYKGKICVPEWAMEAYNKGIISVYETDFKEYFIKTAQGTRYLRFNDYVVKDEIGNIYSVEPDIFEQTYERVEE